MRQSLIQASNALNAEINAQKDAKELLSIFAEIESEKVISLKQYSKISEFFNKIFLSISDKEAEAAKIGSKLDEVDLAKREVANKAIEMLQQNHSLLVDPKEKDLILQNGRMPNSGLIATFADSETGQLNVIMIKNGKFNEFTTPAGKVAKLDLSSNEDAAYINGAVREFKEEALRSSYHGDFNTAISNAQISFANRDELKIPETNKLIYDTRILTVHLGRISTSVVQSWLKDRDDKCLDAQEAFIQPLASLAYTALSAKQNGESTSYYLNRDGVQLKVRHTLVAVLNGPVGQPELGFAHKIANSQSASTAIAL